MTDPTAPTSDTPPYDLRHILAQPFPERMRLICKTWLYQINRTPTPIYAAYLCKITIFYVGGWIFWCSFSPGSWPFEPAAFQKLILWSIVYEGLGFGCSFGPMTGRFWPPMGGFLHFLRPGTTKLPFARGWPLIGGTRRTWLDVAMYAALMVQAFRALIAPEITVELLFPILLLLPAIGISDKTIFLAARAEHYYVALVCIAFLNFGGDVWIAGCKVVWVAIWFWAATSKLNHHFPGVICVMLTNSPLVPQFLRERLFADYPDDLRPSNLAAVIAHAGTVTEYCIPFVLLAGDGGVLTIVGLVVMCSFHFFISSNMPMGMPIEWNVAMVLGGLFLFGHHPETSIGILIQAPFLLSFLVAMLVVVPLYGNFFPSRVSFLMSMRYYAGNWAYSVWLFKKGSQRKLDQLVKAAPLVRDQLAKMLDDEDAIETALMMTPSFRLMHVHGRALHFALPRAVDDIDDYEWMDGEMIAGLALGWNFGDGHLHDLQLLEAIQEQCGFEAGELRVTMVESQPLFGGQMAWTIADAAEGVIETGVVPVRVLRELQPWPTGAQAEAFTVGRCGGTAQPVDS
jgi:hypothetical protein